MKVLEIFVYICLDKDGCFKKRRTKQNKLNAFLNESGVTNLNWFRFTKCGQLQGLHGLPGTSAGEGKAHTVMMRMSRVAWQK